METIFEKVFVETPVDTDGDGKLDLIAVYIKRPKGLKNVPVIFVANPYLQHCNEDWYDLFDVKEDIKAYNTQNIKEEDIRLAETGAEAEKYVAEGKYVITKDAFVVVDSGSAVDVVVDATGVTELGAKISVDCINKGKHIIVLNVEADVVIGPLLHKMAREKGVVYSGTAGDEPGAVMELYDFAKAIGFEVLVIGKGKNNVVNLECTPETCKEEADRKHMNPRMLCCFKDGS